MKAKINFITLAVADLQASKAFYQNAFNFPVSEESDELCLFELQDDFYLVIQSREDFGADSSSGGFVLSHQAESVDRVHEIVAQAEQFGAKKVKTLEEEWGYSVTIVDMDGHRWEIVYTVAGN